MSFFLPSEKTREKKLHKRDKGKETETGLQSATSFSEQANKQIGHGAADTSTQGGLKSVEIVQGPQE